VAGKWFGRVSAGVKGNNCSAGLFGMSNFQVFFICDGGSNTGVFSLSKLVRALRQKITNFSMSLGSISNLREVTQRVQSSPLQT
jgi:hypothetical protein